MFIFPSAVHVFRIAQKLQNSNLQCRQDNIYIYIIYIIYIYIHIYTQSLCISNNYSLKSAQHKSSMILWEEGNAKQFYLVLKVSRQRTNNLQPKTFFDDRCTWLKIDGPPAWNFRYEVKISFLLFSFIL